HKVCRIDMIHTISTHNKNKPKKCNCSHFAPLCCLRLSFIESWFSTPINPAQTLPKTPHCSEKCQIY
ncbi:hypothetical protein, partial [uncultured Helicobacter sp.]|uniref:hypothetical protein n=1 Tax=uncultured Helicobacter sp. TaxID=175537 RepID=UPI0025E67D26